MREDSSDVIKKLDMDMEVGHGHDEEVGHGARVHQHGGGLCREEDGSDMMMRSDMEPEVPHMMGYITRDGNMETTKK